MNEIYFVNIFGDVELCTIISPVLVTLSLSLPVLVELLQLVAVLFPSPLQPGVYGGGGHDGGLHTFRVLCSLHSPG